MYELALTVLRLPSGLQSNTPMNTPGSARAPKSSCHSAVLLMSVLWMTLEMIVPEKTPLGNETWRDCQRAEISEEHLMLTKSKRNLQ